MACENKKTKRLCIIILCLMFCGLPLVAPKNIDCKGKPFHCVNSSHFIICVDLGGGISSTVDEVIIPCPESTICDINNYFECEFPPPTTLTLPIQPSDVSNESGLGKNKVITKVSWENIEITTTSPKQKTSQRSEKYLNNVSITNTEEFTTTKAKLEAITDIELTTIQQDNINTQYQNKSNEKQDQQFTSNSMIDESSTNYVAQSDINKDENTNDTKSNSYIIDTRPTQTNEDLKDRKLSSVGTGTESTPLQSSMSPPEATEFYSYTQVNKDVITLNSSFTTNSEMPTSDITSANNPILSNSRSNNSQILKTEKETTPVTAGIIPVRKKTITVEPKVVTLSYNNSNSSSQINSENSPAEATLNESNPVNLVNPSNDTDNISHFDGFSVTESLTNITSRVFEKHLQSNSTQDHISSNVSKHLDSEQLNNTIDKYEQKNTTYVIGDITTRPSFTEVQKGSANQENNDLSVSKSMGTNQLMYTTDKQALTEFINSSYIKVSDNNKEMSKMIKNSQNLQETDKIRKNLSYQPVDYTFKKVQEILPATDASIFAKHKQDSVGDQIKESITKINIHDEKTMTDLNTNYYVTDSYGVNHDQSIKTFYDSNFNKNGYTQSDVIYNNTTNTYRTDEVLATTTGKNNDIITIVMHNNTEKQNIQMIKTAHNYDLKINKEEASNKSSSTHEKGAVMHKTQKNIITSFIQGEKAMTDLNNKTYAKEDSSSKNQYQSTQTTNSANDEVVVSIADSNIDIITPVPNYNSQKNKETTIFLSKTHEEGVVKHETQKNITTLFIHGGKAMIDLNNKNYAKEDSNNRNQYQSTQTTNSGHDEVVLTTADSNIDMITTALLNYKIQNNKEETTKNKPKTHEEGVVNHEIQKNIATPFIDDGKAMIDINNKNYAQEDSSSKNQYQYTQTTNPGNDEVIVTTTGLNIGIITTTLPNHNFQNSKENTTNNVLKAHEKGAVMHETQKDTITSFIQSEKAMTDSNNKSYAKEDSSKNQYQSIQTTYSGNEEVLVTTTDLNIDMKTPTVSNYNLQKNKDEITKNKSKTHEEGVVKHEIQQNNKTLFIHDGKAVTDLNNKNHAKEDSSSKNQYQYTQTTNTGNDEVIVTTTGLNIGIITTTLPIHNFQNSKENTTNNVLKIHEKGAVMHETQKDITSIIQGVKAMTDSNNKSYDKEDINKTQYQNTHTTNSRNEEVVVTTANSNIDMITTTVPNYNSQKNKDETTKNKSKTREDSVVKHEAPKNIIKIFSQGGKTRPDLNNKNYIKEVGISKNQYQSNQTTKSGNYEVVVTTADSNIDMITKIVPNYNSHKNKKETTKNMSKIHEEGVVTHETQKNITNLFIHDGKAMDDLNIKSYAKEDNSSLNQFQSTQTTNSGNEEVVVTTADSNIDVTTTILNYNSQKSKEETAKNMSKTLKEGVVKHETPTNITNLLIHDEKAMSDLKNKSYAKEDSSSINQFQSTQTTKSRNEEVKDATTESNTKTPIIYVGKAVRVFNNKSFARDKVSKIQSQSTQTSNQFNLTKNGILKEESPLTFNSSTNSFEADKIIVIEHNMQITTDVPDLMFTKVDDSGLTTNLNHNMNTFVSTYGSNNYVTKSNVDIDRSDFSDRFKTITHKNLQETESTDINGVKMTATLITNNLTFEPTSTPINEFKISSKTKSSTPENKVEGTIFADRDFAKTFGNGKLDINDKPLSNIGQEINSRTNRQAGEQIKSLNIGNRTAIIVSEYPPNSSKKYREDLTATRVPKHADVNVLTTISEDFNSYIRKEIGITEKNTMLPVTNAKDLTTVAEDFLTTVTTASYNLKKEIPATIIMKESLSGRTYVNNGRETTVSSSSIMSMSTNTPKYDETKVVESKPLQKSFLHSLNIEADTKIPSSESDKVTLVLNRAVNTRDVNLVKQNSHTENYQLTQRTVLSRINLTSLSPSPLKNKISDTSVTLSKTSVDTESATDISNNKSQQLKKTEKDSIKTYFNKTVEEINENKPNNSIIKSIRSRDITDSKASTTNKVWRMNEKFRNESVLKNNQEPDIVPSELSMKVGSNTGLHTSTTEQNIAHMISKHFTDINNNSSRFLGKTTLTHASSTISSLELTDRSITTAKIKEHTASTISITNDMSDAMLVTDSTINKRKKKSKTYDIGKETLVENLHESDSNISSTTLNKYKEFSNISISNITLNADEPSKKHYLISTTLTSGMMTPSPMNINTKPLTMTAKTEKEYLGNREEVNKNLEITSESTKFFVTDGQNSYKKISVNSNNTTVSHDPQSVSKYYSNSTTRGSIKTTMKNITTMAKRIRDVNSKSTNTVPPIVVVFDYGRQRQIKEGKSATNYKKSEENPDDNINVESSSHNRYEKTDPNDIIVEPMTNTNNADTDNDAQKPTLKVDVRVNDTDMFSCGRYHRGRYPDKNDCRKFYVCVGRNPPIKGICPNNTVYSELRKQCTRNLSHCVRNNKFKCLTEGRFSDFLKDDIYHICIKNKLGAFVLYKFQCQNGFRLDKKTVKCIKEAANSSSSLSSASESSKSNKKSTTEKTSKVTEKFECQEEGKFADTRDCRTYYVCSKKRNAYRRKKKKCESDEVFDRDKKKCVDAESYECDI